MAYTMTHILIAEKLYKEFNKKIEENDVKDYLIVTVALGEVVVDNKTLHKGDSFILLKGSNNIKITGNGKIVTTLNLL